MTDDAGGATGRGTVDEERSFVEAARREKRAALEAAGVATFAYRYERSHLAAEALAAYDDAMGEQGPTVAVAGGSSACARRERPPSPTSRTARAGSRLYFRRDQLGDGYALLEHLDLDDHLGVSGVLFRTRTGEVTVRATALTLLAKSLRPLPRGKTQAGPDGAVTFGGLQDPEVRYRQRYADLAVHPEVREVFRLRSKAVTWIRRYLDDLGFLEVETPILQPLYGGAAARPFATHHNALDMPLYLRIADELYLKRLLVGGFERVYEIGHDFRNEGMDRTHNPEFTMLEFYQAYADYDDMMTLVEGLVSGVIQHCLGTLRLERHGTTLDFSPPFARVPFIDGIRERAGIDLRTASDAEMRAVLHARRGRPRHGGGAHGRPLAGRGVQGRARARADPADLRARLSQAALAAGEGAPVGPQPHRAVRAVRRRSRAGQRVQRAQ